MQKKRDNLIPIRVNDAELKAIDTLAAQDGLSRSAAMRLATLEKAKARGIAVESALKILRDAPNL